MSFSPYLNFNGNTKEALYFYKEAFRTKEPEIMLFSDMPPDDKFPITEENKNLVMHASLQINDTLFMFSDSPPGNEVEFGSNISIMFDSNDLDELKRIFNYLKEDGKVIMEFGKTFWSDAYGYLKDKFGVIWQFNFTDE